MRVAIACVAMFAGVIATATLADDSPAKTKEMQASEAKLKKIGKAFDDAHEALEFYPGEVLDKAGQPLLSWRVAILPYLGEEKLYKQFKLDEPWDSAHNKKLVEQMPAVYAPVRAETEVGLTYYQSFYGPKTMFDPKAKKRPTMFWLTQLNGTSNTILAVEAGVATVWTKPHDLPFDVTKPLPKLGGMFDGDFHTLYCDTSVRFIKRTARERALKCMIQPENDEVGVLYDP